MSRLPVVNQDEDAWGAILNDFLLVSHNADGTLKSTVPLLAPTADIRNQFVGDTPARLVIPIRVTSDTQNRFQIGADGKLAWGPGNIAPDTNLYRSAVSVLTTDGTLIVGSQLYASNGVVNRVAIGANGPASEAGIRFHSSGDTNLYRRSAAALQTDSAFYVGSALVIDAQGGGSGNKIYFSNALDTNLYRSAAGVLKTDGQFVATRLSAVNGLDVAVAGNVLTCTNGFHRITGTDGTTVTTLYPAGAAANGMLLFLKNISGSTINFTTGSNMAAVSSIVNGAVGHFVMNGVTNFWERV